MGRGDPRKGSCFGWGMWRWWAKRCGLPVLLAVSGRRDWKALPRLPRGSPLPLNGGAPGSTGVRTHARSSIRLALGSRAAQGARPPVRPRPRQCGGDAHGRRSSAGGFAALASRPTIGCRARRSCWRPGLGIGGSSCAGLPSHRVVAGRPFEDRRRGRDSPSRALGGQTAALRAVRTARDRLSAVGASLGRARRRLPGGRVQAG